jgi:hypothetical protein
LVSSVIFFSLSSAMVIDHLREIYRGVRLEDLHVRGRRRGCLRSPPLRLSKIFRFRQNGLPLRASDPVQHLIHGFLNAGTRPVKLPCGLGGKLTEHITIPQSM